MSSRLSLAALALLSAGPAAIKEYPLPRANAFPHDVAVATRWLRLLFRSKQ